MTTTIDTTRIIRVLDAERGRFEESAPETPNSIQLDESKMPFPRDRKGRLTVDPEKFELAESAVARLSTKNFPDLLREGVKFMAFSSYNEVPVSYPQWANVVSSNKQKEEYLKDVALGIAPVVPEGSPYPVAGVGVGDGVIIGNEKRGYIIEVTEEMMKFDQIGKVRQITENMARSLRMTEEVAALSVLTTQGNYTRNSTTNDNDQGANVQDLTFSPTALVTAFNTLATMKDRRTGVKIGVNPNTLIVAPKLRWAAEQLIKSPEVMRVGGGTNEIYGTGTNNPFFGAVTKVIVSPYFGDGYQWALIESGRSVQFQRVEPLQVLREQANETSGKYFEMDVLRYRIRSWFGVGMLDDRFAFYSYSNTAPVVN